MRETIAKAVLIYRTYPNMEDDEIFKRLVDEGIDRNVAARLVEFIPCSYVRILFANSSVILNDSYQRVDANGHISPEQPLATVPLWNEIVAYAQSEVQEGVSQQSILKIASHSAEYNGISNLIKKGAKMNGIRTTPLLFAWPENGPEDKSTDDQQNTRGSNKKWWEFWR